MDQFEVGKYGLGLTGQENDLHKFVKDSYLESVNSHLDPDKQELQEVHEASDKEQLDNYEVAIDEYADKAKIDIAQRYEQARTDDSINIERLVADIGVSPEISADTAEFSANLKSLDDGFEQTFQSTLANLEEIKKNNSEVNQDQARVIEELNLEAEIGEEGPHKELINAGMDSELEARGELTENQRKIIKGVNILSEKYLLPESVDSEKQWTAQSLVASIRDDYQDLYRGATLSNENPVALDSSFTQQDMSFMKEEMYNQVLDHYEKVVPGVKERFMNTFQAYKLEKAVLKEEQTRLEKEEKKLIDLADSLRQKYQLAVADNPHNLSSAEKAGLLAEVSDLNKSTEKLDKQILELYATDRQLTNALNDRFVDGVADLFEQDNVNAQIEARDGKDANELSSAPPNREPNNSESRNRMDAAQEFEMPSSDQLEQLLMGRTLAEFPQSLQEQYGPSVVKYSSGLIDGMREFDENGVSKLDSVRDRIRQGFTEIMDRLGLQPSDAGLSNQWINWDIGKQKYLFDHPEESNSNYRLGDPYAEGSDQIQQEIIDRHVGWEILGQLQHEPGLLNRLNVDKNSDAYRQINDLASRPFDLEKIPSHQLKNIGELVRKGLKPR